MGWDKYISRTTGQIYFWNPETSEPTYEWPVSNKGKEVDQQWWDMTPLSDSTASRSSKEEGPRNYLREGGMSCGQFYKDMLLGQVGKDIYNRHYSKM